MDFICLFWGKVSIFIGVPGIPLGFMRLIRVGILHKRRPHSHVHMAHMLLEECHLDCVIHMLLFKDV